MINGGQGVVGGCMVTDLFQERQNDFECLGAW